MPLMRTSKAALLTKFHGTISSELMDIEAFSSPPSCPAFPFYHRKMVPSWIAAVACGHLPGTRGRVSFPPPRSYYHGPLSHDGRSPLFPNISRFRVGGKRSHTGFVRRKAQAVTE